MDLNAKHPDNLHVREYLDGIGAYRRQPVYSVTRTGETRGRPLPMQKTSADHLAPGAYKTDRDFPDRQHRLDECGVGWLTRSARSSQFTVSTEDLQKLAERERRFTTGSTTAIVGPGRYHDDIYNATASPSMSASDRSGDGKHFHAFPFRDLKETVLPCYTVPVNGKGKDRPLPRECGAADHLGPGTYDLPNKFNELGWRKLEKLERAAKKNKPAWSKKEFSHIFDCMKNKHPPHKSASEIALPASGKK